MSDIPDFELFEQILKQYLTPYSPVDLTNLIPNNTISTPKELDREGKLFQEFLSDKSKYFNLLIFL